MEYESLASDLLHELKNNARRWFIAFCVMVGLEIATIVGFMWYISLPVEEVTTTYSQDMSEIENSDVRQFIGGEDDDSF